MTEKNADYWAGYHEEAAKNRRPGHLQSLVQSISQALGRDNGRKQRIFARSPGIFSGMDAEEFGRASSVELAARELKELGIDAGENDPLAILDAHHAGRQWARDYLIPGGNLTGGNRIAGNNGNKLIGGAARDSIDNIVDKYLGN